MSFQERQLQTNEIGVYVDDMGRLSIGRIFQFFPIGGIHDIDAQELIEAHQIYTSNEDN